MEYFDGKRVEFLERYKANEERKKGKATSYVSSDEYRYFVEWNRERKSIVNSEEFLEYVRKVRDNQFNLRQFREFIGLTVHDEVMPEFDVRSLKSLAYASNLTTELLQDVVLTMVWDHNKSIKKSNEGKIISFAEMHDLPVEKLKSLFLLPLEKDFMDFSVEHEIPLEYLQNLKGSMKKEEKLGLYLNIFRNYFEREDKEER